MAVFNSRITKGFRPRTMAAYYSKFCLYLTFLACLRFSPPDSFQAVAMFIEYLAQQGLRAQTITNYISVLAHYFTLYNSDTSVLSNRLYSLAIRAVAHDAPLSFKVKGILSITKLRDLVGALLKLPDSKVYVAICLMAFFGFYRLATLVPPSSFLISQVPHTWRCDLGQPWGSRNNKICEEHVSIWPLQGCSTPCTIRPHALPC